MKGSFQSWYASKITKQMESGTQICDLKPVDLRLSHVKQLSAKSGSRTPMHKLRLTLVFKGFVKAGIAADLHYELEY